MAPVSQTVSAVAFAGTQRIAVGGLGDVAAAARRALDELPEATLLVFDRASGRVIDLDLRGTAEEVAARYASADPPPPRRGRPKLGVVAREVTLLPRHWDWLGLQPGGASVTLRRLVEAASRSDAEAARARTEAAYRFMSTMAGDRIGFEEAARMLFAGDRAGLEARLAGWPGDVAEAVLRFLDGGHGEG
ncbi:MAG: DUF2239 family protein [Phenylobacterium sp.]